MKGQYFGTEVICRGNREYTISHTSDIMITINTKKRLPIRYSATSTTFGKSWEIFKTWDIMQQWRLQDIRQKLQGFDVPGHEQVVVAPLCESIKTYKATQDEVLDLLEDLNSQADPYEDIPSNLF